MLNPEEFIARIEALARTESKIVPHLHDDLLSEGLLALVEACGRYDPGKKAEAFVVVFCRSRMRSWLRRELVIDRKQSAYHARKRRPRK